LVSVRLLVVLAMQVAEQERTAKGRPLPY